MTLSTIDLRQMIETHVRGGGVAPDLDKLTPQELLDAFAIASEEWAIVTDLLDSLSLEEEEPLLARYRARLDRATELRRRARDLLIDLLNPLPR
jgi:hypothetical protein